MARIDLHNFFKFYDEKNPNHVKAVQWLEDNLPVKYLLFNINQRFFPIHPNLLGTNDA